VGRTAVLLDVDRRTIAALALCLGLVGFWVVESSSDLLWPTAWPAAWRPGSMAGQPGPEGSIWLGVGNEARHHDLIVRVTGIDDLPCPDSTAYISACRFRVAVDARSTAVGMLHVVLVFRGGAEASEAELGPYRIEVVDITGNANTFAWHGAALLITGTNT
jgi:hypothetical protein